MKICLGIESTAHTLGIGVINSEGKILKQVQKTFIPEIGGGIHPRKAAEHHFKYARELIKEVKNSNNFNLKDINYVAFSQGPGLGVCLRVGAVIARTLHQTLNIPLIGVNHCLAHLEIGKLFCDAKDPICVYTSGGNTQIIGFDGGRYRVFGETLDIPIGNMLDVFSREAHLQHPGGPKVEKLAKLSNKFVELPYTVKGMDFSFSGLLTAAINKLEAGEKLEDMCFSIQEVSFGMLVEVTERALAHTEKNEVLLTGGVAANLRLQEMLKIMAEEHGATFYVVPKQVAGDNGAMIAWTGLLQANYRQFLKIDESNVLPKWRIDEIEIPWIN